MYDMFWPLISGFFLWLRKQNTPIPPPAASRVGLKFFTSAIIAYRTTQDSPGESIDFCSKISWLKKQAYFSPGFIYIDIFVYLFCASTWINMSGREHIHIYMSTYVFNVAYTYVVYINLCADIFLWKSTKYPDTSACTFTNRSICTIHVHKQNIYV